MEGGCCFKLNVAGHGDFSWMSADRARCREGSSPLVTVTYSGTEMNNRRENCVFDFVITKFSGHSWFQAGKSWIVDNFLVTYANISSTLHVSGISVCIANRIFACWLLKFEQEFSDLKQYFCMVAWVPEPQKTIFAFSIQLQTRAYCNLMKNVARPLSTALHLLQKFFQLFCTQ